MAIRGYNCEIEVIIGAGDGPSMKEIPFTIHRNREHGFSFNITL